MENYVIYQDCAIAAQFEKEKETYSMNPFIEDEMRDYQAQKKLTLYFTPGPEETWLQRDVASFLVSEVQRLYPEYEMWRNNAMRGSCGKLFWKRKRSRFL